MGFRQTFRHGKERRDIRARCHRLELLESRDLLSISSTKIVEPDPPAAVASPIAPEKIADGTVSHSATVNNTFFIADRFEPNNSFETATDVGWLGVRHEAGLSVHAAADRDFFTFYVPATPPFGETAAIDLTFLHANGDIDVRVYNGNRDLIAGSYSVSDNERVEFSPSWGSYYIEVYGFNGATNPTYDLTITVPIPPDDFEEPFSNNSFASATQLGGNFGARWESGLTIHSSSDNDYFKFTPAYTSTAVVDVYFSDLDGDIDVQVFNSTQTLLAGGFTTTDDEHVPFPVVAGQQYFVRVYGYNGAVNAHYNLQVTAPIPDDRFESNNYFDSATDLGVVRTRFEPDLSINEEHDHDYFRFTAESTTTAAVDLTFLHVDGNVDVLIYDANRTPIAGGNSHTDNEHVEFPVTAGQSYFVVVHVSSFFAGADTNYNYDLAITVPIPPDRFEANQSAGTATNLGTLGARYEAGLSIHAPYEFDYFRFTAAATTTAVIDLTFLHAGGDVDLAVYDSATLIGTATSTTDNEHLEFPVTAGQIYYISVYGYQGAVNNRYDLKIDVFPITQVVGRHLFYNQSKFDGNTAGVSTSDDLAIAPDKSAYLPGSGVATFANISSYSRGINGIMVDIADPTGTLTASDFTFRMSTQAGANNTPSTWQSAPAPVSVSVRPGAGVGGSDRVELIWAGGAITNRWLEVIVEGNDVVGGYNTNTGLAQSDRSYFGNRIGDTGSGSPTLAITSATDEIATRGNPGFGAAITNLYDFDRSGLVSAVDSLISRNNLGTLTKINIAVPPAAPTADIDAENVLGDFAAIAPGQAARLNADAEAFAWEGNSSLKRNLSEEMPALRSSVASLDESRGSSVTLDASTEPDPARFEDVLLEALLDDLYPAPL